MVANKVNHTNGLIIMINSITVLEAIAKNHPPQRNQNARLVETYQASTIGIYEYHLSWERFTLTLRSVGRKHAMFHSLVDTEMVVAVVELDAYSNIQTLAAPWSRQHHH